jgi:hypothetical protein
MENYFQKWLKSQGYTREHLTWGAWIKDGKIVSGKILHSKLEEWKKIVSLQGN